MDAPQQPEAGRELSFGERAVGLTFNPSSSHEAQTAQMWAVKAITWRG